MEVKCMPSVLWKNEKINDNSFGSPDIKDHSFILDQKLGMLE